MTLGSGILYRRTTGLSSANRVQKVEDSVEVDRLCRTLTPPPDLPDGIDREANLCRTTPPAGLPDLVRARYQAALAQRLERLVLERLGLEPPGSPGDQRLERFAYLVRGAAWLRLERGLA